MWRLCVFPFGGTADLNRVKMWRLCVFPLETQLIKPRKYSRESRDVYFGGRNEVCDRYMR